MNKTPWNFVFAICLMLAGCGGLPSWQGVPAEQSRQPACKPPSVLNPNSAVGSLTKRVIQKSCDDEAKAKAVFNWIASNDSYDAKGYFNGTYQTQTPEEVIASKVAVCDGYARLFEAMAVEAGLRAKILQGDAKTINNGQLFPNGQPNHVWNAVMINGQWHFVDATWGAGYINRREGFVRRLNDDYFMNDPSSTLLTHWDLADTFGVQKRYGVSRAEFWQLPAPSPALRRLGYGPDVQLKVARMKVRPELVTVYKDAEQVLHTQDERAMYKELPKGPVSFRIKLLQPARLVLHGEGEVVPVAQNEREAVVSIPKQWRGEVTLMREVKPGEYQGLLGYRRGK